jgi:hypothetical protein
VAVGGWRRRNSGIYTLDYLLDEVGLITGNLERAEALACVEILQHIQEELVEQSVLG